MLADTRTVLVNNLVYQWHGPWGFFFNNGAPGGVGGPWYASVVGNRFIKGPATTDTVDRNAYMFVYSINGAGNVAGNKIYRSDNTLANQDGTIVEEMNQSSYNPNVGCAAGRGAAAERIFATGLGRRRGVRACATPGRVLRIVTRSTRRLVNEVKARTGSVVHPESERRRRLADSRVQHASADHAGQPEQPHRLRLHRPRGMAAHFRHGSRRSCYPAPESRRRRARRVCASFP